METLIIHIVYKFYVMNTKMIRMKTCSADEESTLDRYYTLLVGMESERDGLSKDSAGRLVVSSTHFRF